MIEQTLYFKCRPSQLLNLENFLLTLLFIPIVILMDMMLKEHHLAFLLPEKMAVHVNRLPVYLSILVMLNLIWQILKVYCISYEIDPEELRYYSGILSRKHEYIELYRIKDFRVEKPMIYRMFGLGDLTIYSSDKTTPVLQLNAISEPEEKYKILRGLVELNRMEKHVFEVD
ncbi:hypothetical protein AQPE_0440 [Aquipluma nitroreducens]|uniref:YdbS-like PH domain-containing protein n=1 Tax=Aquipluma nitroreducens TaxID=2010828 RepID=A0A5K7S430_9BACT|nr:PH domain-containing protein [Aquipluma nitroreducens]BBE16303.1 hypothetical protein AQPE_0440 [Aquipluma nitroreducens]